MRILLLYNPASGYGSFIISFESIIQAVYLVPYRISSVSYRCQPKDR